MGSERVVNAQHDALRINVLLHHDADGSQRAFHHAAFAVLQQDRSKHFHGSTR
jgi:hypothetical protein